MRQIWSWFAIVTAMGCGKGDSKEQGASAGGGSSASATPTVALVKARVAMGIAHVDITTTEELYGIESKTPGVDCDRQVVTTIDDGRSFECRMSSAPLGKVELTVEYTSHAGTGRLVVPLDNSPYLAQRGSDFTCVGIECKGTAGTMEAVVTAADGTKLTYGGVSAVVAGGKPARVAPDLWPEVQRLTLAELRDRAASRAIKIPLVITFANGMTIESEQLISRSNLLAWVVTYLEKAKTGPALFPGESPEGEAGKALLAMYGSGTTELYGKADKLGDIGRVSVRTQTKRGTRCGKYVGDKTGEETEYGLVFIDETYTIYERRTGKQLATRRFSAEPKACPASFRTDGYREALISSPDPDAVLAWLQKQAG